MELLSIEEINVGERQRKEIAPAELRALAKSIREKGLLHPVVVTRDKTLVAGGRRLEAMKVLHRDGQEFSCNSTLIPAGQIPTTLLSDKLRTSDVLEAELEENILRVNLSWQEEVEARATIHQMRVQANPGHTRSDTAREISDIKGTNKVSELNQTTRALVLEANKHNPKVQRAKSADEAYKAILDEADTAFQAQLAMKENEAEQDHYVIHGDCLKVLPTLNPGEFGAIICDPPYGIEMNKAGKSSNHYYDDSDLYALEIAREVIRLGYGLCKPRAVLFMFCDIEHFVELREHAQRHAWTPWRVPLIWDKGAGGHAPWGRAGFTRSYECILYAVKGQQELRIPGGPDVFAFDKVLRGERRHAAEKPIQLLSHLINLSCLPGDTVLDPCAGSGSIIPAARVSNCRSVSIESDINSYNLCLSRITNKTNSESMAEIFNG